jgi:hypothetical protein
LANFIVIDVVFHFQAAGLVLGNLLSRFLFVAAGNRAIQLKVLAVDADGDVGVGEFRVLLQGLLDLALDIAAAGSCGITLRHLGLIG